MPLVTHLHGASGVGDESDGYAEAWYLPAANNISAGYATEGTWYEFFAGKAAANFGVAWGPGFATFQYPNNQRESTLWYHDHVLGMTRLNVYAGPAGFFLVRGGPEGDKAVLDSRTGRTAVLPGPAPNEGDQFPPTRPTTRSRSRSRTGRSTPTARCSTPTRECSSTRSWPLHPERDFSPIWNPEFFGNMIMVNGNTWPFQTVEQRRYRLRFLNGCQSRFLILDFANIPGVEVWQIGNEGGFLAAPVNLTTDHGNRLLMGLAERADLIVDFTNVPVGNYVLGNVGPDEPFGGGEPGGTPRWLRYRRSRQHRPGAAVPRRAGCGPRPDHAAAVPRPPGHHPLAGGTTRPLALIEKSDIGFDADGNEVDGPVEALLGTVANGVRRSAFGWIR